MTDLEHKPTITLSVHRCWECGRYWAGEHNFTKSTGLCPSCASLRIEQEWEKTQKLERRITSLKGAITRMKKR